MKEQEENSEFFILSPPPNVTGNLHVGHAFTFSIQDFIVRFHKNFLNKNAFLLIGFDHGGMATEKSAGAENVLDEDRKIRFEQIKTFAQNAKSNILNQFKKLNLLFDEKYSKYTFDDDHVDLVQNTFIKLYNNGLISRRLGLVNFDTKFKTAISDLEIGRKTIKSKIYTLQYLLEDGSFLEVATTRPETIFADMALCVNPEDERYLNLIGKFAYIPILNKKIPIISDESVQKDFGTGVLKITPAHSPVDYKIWQKYSPKNENIINVISPESQLDLSMLEEYKESFKDFDKFNKLDLEEAKKLIIDILNPEFKEIEQNIPVGDRSGALVENILMEQWFLNVENMAKETLKNIENTKIYPNIWKNTYISWLENINPFWCISRSVVWGHEIPVYYNNKGEMKVQIEMPEEEGWFKKNEVLDTWFSSALWPISYKNSFGKYPSDVLVTAYDIIFFWVARMVMMSLEEDNSIPFKNIFLHRLVTDSEGKKMSKTVGNVIDPLTIIDEFGVDVLRLGLLRTLSPCGKIRISDSSMLEAKSIITKLENFKKYLEIPYEKVEINGDDQLIIDYFKYKMYILEENFKKNIENYELHLIIDELINFIYEICSWLLEFSKIRKSLMIILKDIYSRIIKIFGAICPEKFTTEGDYIPYEKIQLNEEDLHKVEDLKYVIGEIRSYKKLGIEIEIEIDVQSKEVGFSEIILKMCNVINGNLGKLVEIRGYKLYLNNINIPVLQKKILNIEKEIINIGIFLDKTNKDTPENIIKDKKNAKLLLETELNNLNNIF